MQHGRDRDESAERSDDMTSGQGNTARRAPGTGMTGGRSGVDTESVDFDDMGDLDRGDDDATEAEPATGPGPGYGIINDQIGSDEEDRFDAASDATSAWPSGSGRGPVSAMRIDELTGGMGSGTGDSNGISQGTDTDIAASRGESQSTGTRQRTGLGGPSSGSATNLGPEAGAPFANPSDMGDQG